ncbi:MAG: hypothetical protein Q8J99_17130 [Sulfuritalea sp.]|nr:hypothetical protein [Sulfuritalea sp.]
MGLSSTLTDFWLRVLWLAIGRLGLGLIIASLNAGALRLLPYGTEAAGSASINFLRQLGSALGVTLRALSLEGRERHLNARHGCSRCRKISSSSPSSIAWPWLPRG